MIEVRGFNGKLNFDDNLYRVPNGDYVDALNITRDAQGQGLDEAVSNIVGNQVITDSLPSGTNKIIGTKSDSIRNRVYFFTWNSDGYNRISYYDQVTESIVVLIEDLTDSNNVGILNFDPSYRINHVDIIYRDEEGDLLFWTDGLNPPSKINVQTMIDGTLLPLQRSYIDVAKEPPSAPIYCVYEDDPAITVNNLNNKQFKFKYRFVYDDLEKSVTSAQSEVPIPYQYSLQSTVVDPTKNACIFLVFQTGEENVTKIELLGSESQGTTWSDFYLINVIDKIELGIDSADVYTYKFYNDKAYNPIPLNESIQPFDAVPLIAYTQSLPNGNVLDYGAITEGYNNIIGEYTASPSYINSYTYNGGMLFLAYQNAEPAFGTGDIKIIIAGNWYWSLSTGEQVRINIDDNGTPIFFNSNALNVAGIISQISTQATSAGFTIVSSSANELVINKNAASIITTLNESSSVTMNILGDALNNNSQFAFDWSSRYSLGIVYFDEKGRTNGVIYTQDTLLETPIYEENNINILGQLTLGSCRLPLINFQINSRPPIWANYFEIVRTKNLTKSNLLYWISDYTYKDATINNDGYQYAYISIANLTSYIAANPGIKTLGYEFTPGDRIKFIKLYNSLGNTNVTYTTTNDFQIVESLTNPVLGGVVVTGQVLKIILPQNLSASFDFGGSTYANYLIELYTPSQNFSNELNLYYEFGERYIIGNPGTTQAYHQGLLQNQSEDLITPALYEFYKGDAYFRSRLIPTGGNAIIDFTPKAGITGSYYPMSSLISNNSTHNSNYTLNDVPGSSNNQITVNNSAALNFQAIGYIKVKSSANTSSAYVQLVKSLTGTSNWLYLGSLTANVETTIQINSTVSCLSGDTYIGFKLDGFNGELINFQLKLIDGKNIYAGIIDLNFSDNYDSSAGGNGRAWKFDPNAEQSFNPTLIRFGGEFQAGTTVNDINRFYEENFDVYDRSRGSIKKMFIEGRNQYVFQEFDVGLVTVLTQIVRDTAGNPLSAQSDKLLNKIVYPYIGGYGIGNIPESFAYGKHAKYFIDNNKGVVCRLSTDGITPLSIVYKTNAFFVPFLSKYNDTYNTVVPATGTPTVYGAYDAYTNKYIICMDEIDREDYSQPAFTLAFLESRDSKQGFESFLSYHPENICALNNLLISCKEGLIWTHNNSIYCNFYGVQYDATVTPIFNDQPLAKKTFLSLMETANNVWYCPSMVSQATSYGSTNQESSIVSARFQYLEGQYHAAILRDANSQGGIINGDTMKGNYLKVKLQLVNPAAFYYLNTVSLKYIESPLNVR